MKISTKPLAEYKPIVFGKYGASGYMPLYIFKKSLYYEFWIHNKEIHILAKMSEKEREKEVLRKLEMRDYKRYKQLKEWSC
jgi:hypothetical protein